MSPRSDWLDHRVELLLAELSELGRAMTPSTAHGANSRPAPGTTEPPHIPTLLECSAGTPQPARRIWTPPGAAS